MSDWSVVQGDSLERMRAMEANSVDSIVCDPPAGINFMNKAFDSDRGGRDQWIAWLASVMREGLRVLKPGGHALVWALPRTSHWTGMALEEAGFEVRDRVTHLFGSGFPKSLAVDKAMDKAAGAERENVGTVRKSVSSMGPGEGNFSDDAYQWKPEFPLTAPATDLAKQWAGWGTALKPAAEDWWLARKPLGSTVAQCVAAHGTGALNIDGCRIGHGDDLSRYDTSATSAMGYHGVREPTLTPAHSAGRWPANVVLSHSSECREVGTRKVKTTPSVHRKGHGHGGMFVSEGAPHPGYRDADGTETVPAWECAPDCAVALLDAQSGERPKSGGNRRTSKAAHGWFDAQRSDFDSYGDTGGASRFYYCAKSSRREREAGLEGMPTEKRKMGGHGNDETDDLTQKMGSNRPAANVHPCVKPLSLMRWLTRLVTPPGGLVLDPFAGSGSTGCAAVLEGFRFLGIEQDEGYAEIARRRLAHWERVARRYHRLLSYRATHPVDRPPDRPPDPSQLVLFGEAVA